METILNVTQNSVNLIAHMFGHLLQSMEMLFCFLTHSISYGYRGRDCRSNLYLLPTGEIVYFNASVVVLYNVEEQQQRHYLGHNDDVKW